LSEPSPGPATAALVVHAALATTLLGLCATPLQTVYRAFAGPVAFLDEVPSPAWLMPAAFGVAFVAARLFTYVVGRPLKIVWTWALVIVLTAALIGRASSDPTGAASYSDLHGAPPAVQTIEAMRRLRDLCLAAVPQGKLPSEAEMRAALAVNGRELQPSYLYRGLAHRPFHLVRLQPQDGPVEAVRADDLPGTIYVTATADLKAFWISAVVLLQEGEARHIAMLPTAEGVEVLSNVPLH
jgi:hypothetical protein